MLASGYTPAPLSHLLSVRQVRTFSMEFLVVAFCSHVGQKLTVFASIFYIYLHRW